MHGKGYLATGKEKRYSLAPGTQVREEDFGLLFYTMEGPRLYFLISGGSLSASFFEGEITLRRHVEERGIGKPGPKAGPVPIQRALNRLVEKGVIVGC